MARMPLALALSAVLLGCDWRPSPADGVEEKNICVDCKLFTKSGRCPACKKGVAKIQEEAPGRESEVGASSVKPRFACPLPGCVYTNPRKGSCGVHADRTLRVQWFVCRPCQVSKPLTGECASCGKALERDLH